MSEKSGAESSNVNAELVPQASIFSSQSVERLSICVSCATQVCCLTVCSQVTENRKY